MLVIFTDLKFTVCHNKPPCQNRFCFVHAVLTGICLTLLLWKRSGERCCRVTVCSVSTARGRKEGGRGGQEQIYISEKKGRGRRKGEWGIIMSIYTACRVEKKLGQKEKGKRRWSFQGEGKRISIHPGPGELVLQGHHPLEVQNLPANQARKGIRVNDLYTVLKQRAL